MPKAFGSDRLEELPDGGYRLHCRASKGWITRKEKSLTRSEFPGTAVLWEEVYYEVAAIDEGNALITYDLVRWNDDHVMRTIEAYSAEAERERARQREKARQREAKRKTFIALALLTGNLPAEAQEEMQSEYGIPAARMTLIASIPLFLFGAFCMIWLNITMFAPIDPPLPRWLLIIGSYLFFESGVRVSRALSNSEPSGSIAGLLAYGVYEVATGKSRAAKRQALSLEIPDEQHVRDRYDLLKPLLSFLTPAEQRLLQKRFTFDPFRTGKQTAAVLLIVFGVQAYISITDVGTITGGMTDFVLLLVAGYFIGEQVVRLRRLFEGQPAGSVLGSLVRPLARRLFA